MPPETKTAIRRETMSYPVAGLKAVDTEAGTFDAIVSVFGNVDLHGHRITATAFDASLERWRASGDPVPVIFSHQWNDLFAYLGDADPKDIEALQPGDPELPEAIRDLGGLRVKGTIDTDEPEGRKALKLLKRRLVREFSFAYDVFDEAKADDGFLDFLELDLIEVGPTLKGANPLTQLIGAKAAKDQTTIGETLARVAEVLDTKSEVLADAFGIDVINPAPDRAAKAFVSLPDTVERLQEAIVRAGIAWASDIYGDNLYTVQLEGTYPADSRAVLYVELWDDPPYKGRYFSATFEITDGVVAFADDPELVELAATIVGPAKRATGLGFKEGRRNAGADLDRIQSIHDLTFDLGAACASEEPDGDASEAARPFESASPSVMRAILDLELQDT